MTETRHRTRIEILVDDRKIRGLDKSLQRAFDDDMLETFERTIDRAAKNLETLTKSAERFEKVMRRVQAGGGGTGSGGGGRGAPPPGGARGSGDRSLLSAVQTLSQSISQLQQSQQQATAAQPSFANRAAAAGVGNYLGGLGTRLGSGEGFVSQAASGIPVIGGFLSGAISTIQRYYATYAQAMAQRSRSVGTLGSGLNRSSLGAFQGFGLDMPSAYGQAAQFAGQAGLSGAQLTPDFYRRTLEMQMLGGIQGGGASVLRAQGVGGGAMMGPDVQGPAAITAAVSAGMVSGIREARLGQFVQAATSVLEQGRTEGSLLGLQNVLAVQRGISGLGMGFIGEQGTRAMQSSVGAMRGFQPGQDAASLIGLRAAGFGRGRSYHEALQRFQESPEAVLPNIIRELRGMGVDNEDAQVELMRQILPKFLGFTPSVTQARSLVSGDLSGFGLEGGAGTAAGEQFLERRRGRIGGAFDTPAIEAADRNRQIGTGGRVAGSAIAIRNAERSLTESTLPTVAEGVRDILTFLENAWDTFQSGGIGEMFKQMFGEVLGNLGSAIYGGVGDALGVDTEGLAQTANEFAENPVETLNQLADDTVDLVTNPRAGRASIPVAPNQPAEPGRRVVGRRADGSPVYAGEGAGADGPTSSAVDALRRMQRDAGIAADVMERTGVPGEGELALG